VARGEGASLIGDGGVAAAAGERVPQQANPLQQNASAVRYSRILLKLSGAALAGDKKFGIDPPVVDRLTEEIQEVVELGVSLGIVVGGGNIVRGAVASEQGMDRVTADYMGMLATVINALALQDSLESRGIETRVLTAIRMEELAEPYIRRRALRHLEKGRVVFFAGGTGNPYFSTDTAAVLRAIEMEAQVILKATGVDGVYSADPREDRAAEFIQRIDFMDVVKRGLRVMDTTAITLCMENNVPVIVFNIEERSAIRRIALGDQIGSLMATP
jgi:uridylate kinase